LPLFAWKQDYLPHSDKIKKYQKAQKKCNKANEKIQDLNLTPQQWDTVDAAITAENISSIEYIRIAYKQGIIDAFSILRETL
jgi:hypothetical protein